MVSSKVEQRINLKFLVKLNKTATESFRMLTQVYGKECMSRARVFEWHKRFSEGRDDVEDDDRCGRPCTSRTDSIVKRIEQIVQNDRRLSIRMIAEMVSIDKETVRQILHEDLNMTSERKRNAKQINCPSESGPECSRLATDGQNNEGESI